MRTLSSPLTDEVDLYDRLRKRRRPDTADVLLAVRETVLSAYSDYMVGDTSSLSSVIKDKATAKKLRSNYPILRSGAMANDGAEILARSRVCCLCGLRDTSELDHYLPKQIFPEFAAYSVNLVPVCGVCNKQKDEDFRNDDGGLAFIHAYLDELPSSERFLAATLSFDNAVLPSFELLRSPGMAGETFDVLTSQFNRLGLRTIYAEEAVELLAEKYGAIEEYFADGGPDTVQKYLRRDALSAKRYFGLNHWKPAILTAAADSVRFCDAGFRLLASS